jgi:hypothetical protein
VVRCSGRRRASGTLRRLGLVVAAAGVAAVGAPVVASARPQSATLSAAGSAGAAYGGVTPQGWAVVVELNKNRKKVVRATIGLSLNCTSGGLINLPDHYTGMRIGKNRKFGAAFGPQTIRNDDGTTTDFQGSMSGKLNAARTRLSGKWRLTLTDHDAAGAVTDTCDSGSVSWKAKQ